ncbi:hypothetical protein [Martelella mediterranea]|uniref:Uncharacterized protein n=1 Tax=Martelella mediterranea TaxID=293089 RepID=A0A4R3NIY4_9HYPH|nr:hypothetical protein [Martelella mediterranea]TCT34648.1 hypothetical protein EDC90_103342 [Martelella mediterranea]
MVLLDDEIAIVNAACALIGEDAIQSFDDDDGGNSGAGLIYGMVVDFNLGIQPAGFQFAREMRQLSRIDEATAFTGYTYVFDIPAPYTGTPVFLTDDPSDPNRRYQAFILTNGQVHASDDPLYAMIKFRPRPSQWTATFRRATVTAIAAELAFSLASDRNSRNDLQQMAYGSSIENYRGGQMRAALSEDGFSNPPRPTGTANNPLERAWRG